MGRVTHLTIPSPKILYFLSHLRALVKRSETRREIGITPQVIHDLQLFLNFINNANKGINLNLCTFRCPAIVYRADACPQGIRGFSHRGRAWRFKIPAHLQFRATLNFLECIAFTTGIWIDIIKNNTQPLDCELSMTDSSTTDGWLHRSNFNDEEETNLQTGEKLVWARYHSTRMLDNKIKEYSQWLPGKENEVADSLSRDDHICDQLLTSLLFS